MNWPLQTLVWDNHACMPLRPEDTSFLPQLAQVREAGVDAVTINVACGSQSFADAEALAISIRQWVMERPADFTMIERAGDAQKARADGRLGVCFDVEGGDAIDGDICNIARLYELGVRWMLPSYNVTNAIGGGCLEDDNGLTAFGHEVVAEMNRVGMVICTSHCGHQTARDVIAASNQPTIFSHSNAKELCDHPRNIPDDLLRACAEKGGVVGICGVEIFLGDYYAMAEGMAAHLHHAINVAGEDHVGIAIDYVFDVDEMNALIAADPEAFPPDIYPNGIAIMPHHQLKEVHSHLQAMGHRESTLAKVFGGNHMRIAEEVWNEIAD